MLCLYAFFGMGDGESLVDSCLCRSDARVGGSAPQMLEGGQGCSGAIPDGGGYLTG